MHRPDVHVVVEVERAGVLGRDLGILEARFGKDQRLRVDRNIQLGQDRTQIAVFGFIGQRRLAVLETLFELRDGIVQVIGAIVDGRIAKGDISLVTHRDLAARAIDDRD